MIVTAEMYRHEYIHYEHCINYRDKTIYKSRLHPQLLVTYSVERFSIKLGDYKNIATFGSKRNVESTKRWRDTHIRLFSTLYTKTKKFHAKRDTQLLDAFLVYHCRYILVKFVTREYVFIKSIANYTSICVIIMTLGLKMELRDHFIIFIFV
jgi:hypothetical protein